MLCSKPTSPYRLSMAADAPVRPETWGVRGAWHPTLSLWMVVRRCPGHMLHPLSALACWTRLWGVELVPGGSHLNFLWFWPRKSYTRLWWSRGPPQSCFRVGATLLSHLELTVLFLFSLCLDNLPSSADSIFTFLS